MAAPEVRRTQSSNLDDYTANAESLFDKRFRKVDSDGIYFSHQPIYGFRQGHAEPFAVNKYVRSHQILKTLAHLQFSSMLDVGGAEGYKAGLISKLFGARSINSDISTVACKRGVRIFGIPSVSADIGNLPFGDGEFDVVLCSETLEHVADPGAAIFELMRIAKFALIVTVPHDPESVVRVGMRQQNPLGHIHGYDENSFDHLKAHGYQVITHRMLNWATMIIGTAVEAMPMDRFYIRSLPYGQFVKTIAAGFSSIYNLAVPVLRLFFGKRILASVIELDERLCRLLPTYNAVISVILKDQSTWAEEPAIAIRAVDVLDFSVSRNPSKLERNLELLSSSEALSP